MKPIRFLAAAFAALLLAASPALPQTYSVPNFGVQDSGSPRELAVRNPASPSNRVPLGNIEPTYHVFMPYIGGQTPFDTPERHGAKGDNIADDTAALQACASSGRICRLGNNKLYRITSSIIVNNVQNAGFVGDGISGIFMPAASFTNTSLVSSDRYGSNACGIYAHGDLSGSYVPLNGFLLKNVKIQKEVFDGQVVGAVCAKNVANFVAEDNEIFNFAIGYGIVANSLSGNSRITRNYIHDFYSNAVWPSIPQSTAIAIDPDRVNGVNSYQVHVSHNIIKNILHGPVPQLAWGYQTDGINAQGSAAGAAGISRLIISDNTIDGAGECIDNFGSYNIISNNSLYNCVAAGIKLIHGASYCQVYGNLIDGTGLWGILVSEGSSQDTAYNHIYGNRIVNIDPNFLWGTGGSNAIHSAPLTTVAIKITDPVGGFGVKGTLIEDNYIDPGTYGNYNYSIDPTATGTIFRNNRDAAAGTGGYILGSVFGTAAGSGSIIPAIPTLFKATISAYTLTNADGTKKVPFDTVIVDSRGEYDSGNTRWKAHFPGWYHIEATTFFTSATLGFEFKSNINVNGSFAAFERKWISSTGEQSYTVEATVPVVFGQYVEISDALTDTATRTITAGVNFTRLTITQVQ